MALRVLVRVAVPLRVRLLVGVLDTPMPLLEGVTVDVATREGELLGGREAVAVGLAGAVRLAEAGHEAEAERGGVRLTDGDAEEEEEEEPEEVSVLELLGVPVDDGEGIDVGESLADAALAEAELGYWVPSGRYWEMASGFDKTKLSNIDNLWLAASQAKVMVQS